MSDITVRQERENEIEDWQLSGGLQKNYEENEMKAKSSKISRGRL